MVVSPRCWSGRFGLWIVLLAYKVASGSPFWVAWRGLPELTRVGLALLAFAPWVLDLVAYDQHWWLSDTSVQMPTGILGGLGAGALLLPMVARRSANST